MKTIRYHEFGSPEKLILEDTALPEPKPGEVRLKVTAAGVNFVEIYQRRGWYNVPLPMVPGGEFAGIVDKVGEGVTDFQVGDRAATASGAGGYAEYALVPASKLVPVPEQVTLEQAAAVLLQGMTAHYLAVTIYPLKNGETALVHAGAGGVGQLLIQIAKMRGARVLATVSTEEKAKLASEAGADEVILYTQADFEKETRRLTDGRGVDVVYDAVGKTTFMQSLSSLRARGMLVLYGQSSGPVDPFDPQLLQHKGSLFLTRPTLGHYTASRDELIGRATDLFNWLSQGELKVRIDRTYPLAEAGSAHQYLEDRLTRGKVLLVP